MNIEQAAKKLRMKPAVILDIVKRHQLNIAKYINGRHNFTDFTLNNIRHIRKREQLQKYADRRREKRKQMREVKAATPRRRKQRYTGPNGLWYPLKKRTTASVSGPDPSRPAVLQQRRS